jgi:hypothetical protein
MNKLKALAELFLSSQWEECLPLFKGKYYELGGAVSPDYLNGMKLIIEMPKEAWEELKSENDNK